jgi:hypothetical protein
MRSPSLLLAAALAALAPRALADVLLTRRTENEAYETPTGAVPAKASATTVWVGADRLRIDDGERVVIVRLDQKQVHVIDPVGKTASTLDLPVDFAKLAPPDVAPMLETMARTTTVATETTAETRRIRDWNAQKSVVRLGGGASASLTVWISKDLPIDPATYTTLVSHAMSVRPGGSIVAAEIRKLGGVSVLTEREQKTGGLTLRSRDELVSAEVREAPAGTYEIPTGFALKPFDALAEIQRSMPKRPAAPAAGEGGAPR